MARFSDDHMILGDEISIDQLIKDYDARHRATLDGVKVRITQKAYRRFKGFSSLQWLLFMQGDPTKPLSDGKKELIARLVKKEYSP